MRHSCTVYWLHYHRRCSYLLFEAPCFIAGVSFMVGLLETRGCGPASGIFSGRFFWSNRGLAWRKASQCGITTATDIERHVCGGDYKRQRKGIIAKSNHLPLYRFIKRLAFHLGRQKVAHFWEVLLHPLLYLLNSTP